MITDKKIDNDNKLSTTVYRKPTHTDRLLDQSSYNPTSHKATTIQTLTRRAQLVCDSTDSLADENNYLDNVFNKNNYNKDFVRRNTCKDIEPNVTNNDTTPVTTVTIPYVKGTSETIALTDSTTLQHLCRSQTYYHFTTTTD